MFFILRRSALMFLSSLLLVATISACTQIQPLPLESPLTAVLSPLSPPGVIPLVNMPEVDIPKGGKESGVIVARVYSSILNDYLAGIPVYLADILPLSPGDGYLITFKEQESIHIQSDTNGYLVFDNVPPGEYGLIVFSPLKSSVISDPNGEQELRIRVEAGQVLNLGELQVAWP